MFVQTSVPLSGFEESKECNLRIAARAVEGISICEKASAGSEEAELALSIAVTGVRYLLEGNRARVCKYASRVHEKKPQTPKKKTTAFDYSKWDHLDSDSDADVIEHTSGENVWAAPPPNDAVDAARFVILCASLSSYGLCGGATWTEADVKDCLTIARLLRSSSESSWLLKPREGEIFDALRAAGPRYAFLLRDAFQHHISLRPSIARDFERSLQRYYRAQNMGVA